MLQFKKVRAGIAAVLAVSALSLTACSSADSGSGTNSASSTAKDAASVPNTDYLQASYDELKQGGTLKLALAELSEQQNIWHQDSTAYTRTVWNWYNPTPVWIDDHFEPQPDPNYITAWQQVEADGNTVVTLDLNDAAKFNDGTPIDYKVYQATWQINNGADPEKYPANATDGFDRITSVERGDSDYQVKITFKGAYPWWKVLFGTLAHPALLDEATYKEGYVQKLHPEWGAGPYTVKTVDFQQGFVTFEPNPNWWGKAGKLDSITYTFMEDQASLNAFKNGEIDGTGISSKDRLAAVADMKGIAKYTAMSPRNNLLILNAEAPALADIDVRHAIMEAVDQTQLNKIRYDGLGYTGTTNGSFVLYNGQEGYEDNAAKAFNYDPEKSKALLEKAGWMPGSDGIREKDGQRLSLNYPAFSDSPVIKSTNLALQKMMKDVGIELNINQLSSKDFSSVITKKNFDLMGMAFGSSDPYGVAYFKQIYGSDSGLNKSSTGTKEFDAKIAQLESLPTEKEQIAKANELEVEALQLYGIMPMPVPPEIVATKEGLANYGAMGLSQKPRELIGWKS